MDAIRVSVVDEVSEPSWEVSWSFFWLIVPPVLFFPSVESDDLLSHPVGTELDKEHAAKVHEEENQELLDWASEFGTELFDLCEGSFVGIRLGSDSHE